MDQITVKERIQKVIELLGAPVMDYSPVNANREREIIINKAVMKLFKILNDMEKE